MRDRVGANDVRASGDREVGSMGLFLRLERRSPETGVTCSREQISRIRDILFCQAVEFQPDHKCGLRLVILRSIIPKVSTIP